MVGSNPKELHTERLLLRPFRPGDVDAIARYASDEKYLRFLSPTHPGAKEFVDRNVGADWSVERSWVITLDGEIVGSVFLGINANDNAAELACLVAPEFWRMGIGFEASLAAIGHAFIELDLAKVVARSDVRHKASIGLMTKLGMRHEGVAHSGRAGGQADEADEVIYELERKEWLAPPR